MTITAERPFRASRYTTGAILLHWTIALLVVGQIAGGWAMTALFAEGSRQQYFVFQLHKSVGITILILTVARVLWRAFNPPPAAPASVTRWEGVLSGIVHKAFYGLLLAVPLAGWLIVSASSLSVPTQLFFLDALPWPHLPGFDGLADTARRSVADGAAGAHALLAWTMGVLVALHVAGALKHHLADGHFIGRMWPRGGGDGPRRSFGHATTFLVTLAFVLVMIASATVARRTVVAADGVSPDAEVVLATTAPAPDEGGAAWTVIKGESALGFSFGFGGATLTGTFPTFDADIRFDPDDLPRSSITAAVDLTTATVAGTGISPAQLKGPDGLSTSGNPSARFEAGAIRAEGEAYVADGTLTLRGLTAPVQLAFAVAIEGNRARATGTATLDRLAFSIAKDSDPAASTLAREVTVTVTLVADRR